MMIVLLLGAIVCMGLSDEIQVTKYYGSSHQFWVPTKTHSIQFNPKDSSDVRILWTQGSNLTMDGKHTRMGRYLIVRNVTQMDSGRYIMRGKDQEILSTYTLDIKEIIKTYMRQVGESLRITYDLEPNSCNIYYYSQLWARTEIVVHQGKLRRDLDKFGCKGFELIEPCGISNDALQLSCNGHFEIKDQNDNKALLAYLPLYPIEKTLIRFPGENFNFTIDLEPNSCNIYYLPEMGSRDEIVVRQGKLQRGLDRFGCVGFELLKPCGILNDALQMSCQGTFSVKDQNDGRPLEVSLIMNRPPGEPSYIRTAVGIVLSILFCGYMGRYFCGGTPTKKRAANSPAEPDVQYQEYDHEPVRPRPDQFSRPSGAHYPPQPAHTPTDPLVHHHPDVKWPSASSEVSAPAEPADAPTVQYEPAPQFELKGLTFLTSDSNPCDVYTSDKLNFL
ncbi:uncharacterized protein LOC131981242 [Centropristis striata]|uniref:uncharacterized protein LOC131981242 n=1 Tax=Centropristis striata TaxID=184440 RepID=UPI0027DF80E3|nr:uncharacterized protein LOC131981242 [Centropristis striata]